MSGLVEAILAGDGDGAVAAVTSSESEARGPDGTSALLLAHYRGMRDVVEAIRAQRALELPEAAAVGDVRQVADRLADGAEVDGRTPDGFTPLQLAAHFDHADVAAVLVRAGADVRARATGAMTVQPLHAAAASPTGACLPLLIAVGAPLDEAQGGGITPLHEVAHRGEAAMVELLLAAGADVGVVDAEGRDAAAHAEAGGHGALAARLRGVAGR